MKTPLRAIPRLELGPAQGRYNNDHSVEAWLTTKEPPQVEFGIVFAKSCMPKHIADGISDGADIQSRRELIDRSGANTFVFGKQEANRTEAMLFQILSSRITSVRYEPLKIAMNGAMSRKLTEPSSLVSASF